MNYIWDILLKADSENIPRKNIKFLPASVYSPYMEIAFTDLNTNSLQEEQSIEINPYYRFHEIFKDLLHVDLNQYKEFREVLFDIIIYYLAELDLSQGLNKQEFYKKFIMKDIIKGLYGEKVCETFKELKKNEIDYLLNSIITLYSTGTSLHLFKKVTRNIFNNSIIYISKDNPKVILIYLGEPNGEKLRRKIDMIINLFLPINMKIDLYWENHFGIIGIDETMKINQIVIN